MARHKSALKQARHSLKRQALNKASRTRYRNIIKETRGLLKDGNSEQSQAILPKLYSNLDRLSRRGVLHRNAAARLKSRLTKQSSQLQPKAG